MGAVQSSMKRCDLCNFKIEDGDELVPGRADRIYAIDPMYGIPCRYLTPGRRIVGIYGTKPRMHHASCARQAPLAHDVPHPAAFRLFEPGPQEDGRRHRWTLRQFIRDPSMPQVWPPRDVVFGPVFIEYAAAWNENLWRICTNKNVSVKLTLPIYVHNVEYEEQKYIRYLSNTPQPDNPKPVYTPDMRPEVDTVYFAESYMGVVDLVFGSRRCAPPVHQHADVYWRAVLLPDVAGTLTTVTDGLKIRTIESYHSGGWKSTASRMAAALPQPYDLPLLHFPVDHSSAPERVNAFTFNEPGTIAYSVCWNQTIVAVHAHKAGEDFETCYAHRPDYGPTPVWQLLPIEAGEHISMTFHHSYWGCRQLYITVKTNKGRLYRFGPQGNLCDQQAWSLVDRHRDDPYQIYFDNHPRNLSGLAFDGWRRFEQIKQGQGLRVPDPPFDPKTCTSDFFCSEALLNCVVSVTPCWRSRLGVDVIVGLLLRFGDGHHETLGQVQLNALGTRLEVPYGPKEFWLRIEKVSDSYPNVVEVRFDRPPLDSPKDGVYGGRCWFAISLYDNLEWWYTDTACILQWHGQRTPGVTHHDHLQKMALAVWNNCTSGMDVDSSMIPGYDQTEDFGDLIDPHSH